MALEVPFAATYEPDNFNDLACHLCLCRAFAEEAETDANKLENDVLGGTRELLLLRLGL